MGASKATTAAGIRFAIAAGITWITIAVAAVVFTIAAVAASASPIRVYAARRLNDFSDAHYRLVSVNKDDTSGRIAAFVDRELGVLQPCSDRIDADFGAQKPFTALKIVNSVLLGEFKNASAPGRPHPSASDKYRGDAAFQNQPGHFLVVLLLHHNQRFWFLKYFGINEDRPFQRNPAHAGIWLGEWNGTG